MRAVAAYLIVYSALVLGALLALWQGGVLNRISGLLLATILAVAAGFGVLLAVTSRPPRQVDDTDPA